MPSRFPKDLAVHVHSQLAARNKKTPAVAVLTELFETLYFASLQQEESQPISCRVAFIDRKRPDPHPPDRVVADRWKIFALAEDLPLNVRNLVKLSTAVDPWGSTLAVDTDSAGELRIWGLVDQSVHYSTFVVKEAASGPEMPGVFQAVIQGIGEIAVYRTYLLLGSLKQNTLVKGQQRVFQSGLVHSKLMSSISIFQQKVRKRIGRALYEERGHWDESLEDIWISALCRILIGIQKYQHGGAVLISDVDSGLNPKYQLQYHRLADALFRASVLTIEHTSYSDAIHENYLDKEADDIPAGLYLDESVSETELRDTNDELTGCVRFLASLSRVDGLIWLDSQLHLKAFGVEITVREDPAQMFMAHNSKATKRNKLNLNHYGTRHRSMFRYCAANRNSVGFVVSQDGNVRAVTRSGKHVFLWDNVRIQSLRNARTLTSE
jgi:DNA integrity scanning protein DisA with diadenylate cyclase activity